MLNELGKYLIFLKNIKNKVSGKIESADNQIVNKQAKRICSRGMFKRQLKIRMTFAKDNDNFALVLKKIKKVL
jgi:hypothetical protein